MKATVEIIKDRFGTANPVYGWRGFITFPSCKAWNNRWYVQTKVYKSQELCRRAVAKFLKSNGLEYDQR